MRFFNFQIDLKQLTQCIQTLRYAFEHIEKDGRFECGHEFDVVLSKAFKKDVVSCAQFWIFLEGKYSLT